MIKILISGILGRMGREILSLVEERDDITVVAGFDNRFEDIGVPITKDTSELPEDVDVIVDFSSISGAMEILRFAVSHKIPLVTGTTGFSEDEESEIKNGSKEIPILKTSNMSLGVNTLIQILKRLPEILVKKFDIEIVETHHRMKKDSPSGTAKVLARILAEKSGKSSFTYGRKGNESRRGDEEIGIHSVRGGSVVGIHSIYFHGDNESIEITHRANSRKIFAFGALSAVLWIVSQKPGLYSMEDLLN
jgi:4-hydroxy-tetrahydrodipicolinate reductase